MWVPVPTAMSAALLEFQCCLDRIGHASALCGRTIIRVQQTLARPASENFPRCPWGPCLILARLVLWRLFYTWHMMSRYWGFRLQLRIGLPFAFLPPNPVSQDLSSRHMPRLRQDVGIFMLQLPGVMGPVIGSPVRSRTHGKLPSIVA